MKSIAQQSPAELGGHLSVLHRQRRDHIQLGHQLQALARTPEEQQAPLLQAIYRLVFPHAFAEEAVLWPVIRRVLPDGHELTLRVEREHQEINELVRRLDEIPHKDPERQIVLRRTVELLIQDVRDEEDLLLPRLQAALTPMQLMLLGVAWEAVRRVAPTRPHPVVSRRPPGNVLSALPLSLLDRLRDRSEAASFLRSRGAFSSNQQRSSAALRAASDAVEQVPGMKAGEDPATRIPASPGSGRRDAAVIAGVTATVAAMILWQRRSSGTNRKRAGDKPRQPSLEEA